MNTATYPLPPYPNYRFFMLLAYLKGLVGLRICPSVQALLLVLLGGIAY